MQKKHDYIERLVRLFESEAKHEFSRGKHDCFTLCAAAVKATTGHDYMAHIKYDTAEGANEILSAHGGAFKALIKYLGNSQDATVAQPGDICLMDSRVTVYDAYRWDGGGKILLKNHAGHRVPGVMSNDCRHVVLRAEQALVIVRRELFSHCWSIG